MAVTHAKFVKFDISLRLTAKLSTKVCHVIHFLKAVRLGSRYIQEIKPLTDSTKSYMQTRT